jgi:TonB family protein
MITSAIAISWLYGQSPVEALSLLKIGGRQPLRTAEGLAVSFVAFSCLLALMLIVYKNAPHSVTSVRRQIVDIEFISGADAVNRHDVLPGTKVAAEQRKVSSNAVLAERGATMSAARMPETTRQTAVARQSPQAVSRHASDIKRNDQGASTDASSKSKSNPAQVADRAPIAPEMFIQRPQAASRLASAAPSTDLLNQYPSGSKWVTKTVSLPKPSTHSASNGWPALEEVAPPELVEVTDTQGESRATEAWQAGGHSTGGKGAQTPLSVYLKELHKRIKRAWSPPKGETRTAEILFRIKHNGQLESIKLIQRSGNEESDEAAIGAIAACAPFKPLPDVITNEYLDLEYTFNYTVDRLSEAPGRGTE